MDPGNPPLEPSRNLLAAAATIERVYPSEFVSSGLGRLLTLSAGFAQLAEPGLPDWLRRDAKWIGEQIDWQLRETLAVCVLSVTDVIGEADSDDDNPPLQPTTENLVKMCESYYTRHFSDIICDGDFWVIVGNIRADVG